ncbi:peptidase PmbA [Vitreoscilla sp. C1]|uniref:metalloprotease PmbA n=1 Tax=Vitreoscilla sp. (strain C1) TaxID=96942 RepID=UPI000CDCB91A|nr:metalloprotease PmbA [Vitreoscilla sp. C1]AUZ05848.1 peptidase PmbA [Vitreoscilla sp. C1]
MFNHSEKQLSDLAQQALDYAKQCGASAADVGVSESVGQSVSIRLQEIEQLEYQQDKSFDITVYMGQRKGNASSSDFSAASVKATVDAALNIAKYTAEDDCAGLADSALLARTWQDLDLFHPWALDVDKAIEEAKACEAAAMAADSRIHTSEGASINTGSSQYVLANSNGFAAFMQSSRHSKSCSVLAQDENGMERDYWYDQSRIATELLDNETLGKITAERTVRRLGARQVPTGVYPVVFDNTVSGSLISHLVGALSGGSLYRKSSFLQDSLGTSILPAWVQLREEPHIVRGLSSTYFDSEGVATKPRDIIKDGVVEGYFLSSYSARKLGMQTTANAGGAHNLVLSPNSIDLSDVLKQMGTGLLVTELMGQGVNALTGDYSRGAAGFWVENGVIVYPVDEITIAGQLQNMFKNIVAIGNDGLKRSAHRIGSILISEMTIAGDEAVED